MTPEGKMKAAIKIVLETYREQGKLYYFMPVQTGYGKPTLDYLGFILGYGFAIEAKAPGKKLRDRQLGIAKDIRQSGAPVFVIDSIETLTGFNDWCQEVVAASQLKEE